MAPDYVLSTTAEKFVASVSGQADSNRLASQFRYQESWDLGGIGKRLIVNVSHRRDGVLCFSRRHTQLCMLGPQMLGDLCGVVCLVVANLTKTYRERFDT